MAGLWEAVTLTGNKNSRYTQLLKFVCGLILLSQKYRNPWISIWIRVPGSVRFTNMRNVSEHCKPLRNKVVWRACGIVPFLHICVCVVYVLPLECLCEYLLMNYKIRILARLDVFLHKSNPAITAFIFVLEFHLTNSGCSVPSSLFRSQSQEDWIKDTPSKRGDYSFSAGRHRCLSGDFWLATHLKWG